MHRQALHRELGRHRRDHRPRLRRRADADGVAERDLVAAHLGQLSRHVGHGGRRHLALVGAAQGAGDIAADADLRGLSGLADRREAGQAVGDRAVDVLVAEALGGGAEHRDLGRAGGARRLEALHVGGEHGIAHAVAAPDPGHHLGAVGHLRHPLGRDEGGGLDHRQAALGEPVDERDLGRGGDLGGLVLKPVPGPHLDHLDPIGHGRGRPTPPPGGAGP